MIIITDTTTDTEAVIMPVNGIDVTITTITEFMAKIVTIEVTDTDVRQLDTEVEQAQM